jgi:DNA-binding NarL/FixJ family response regulator
MGEVKLGDAAKRAINTYNELQPIRGTLSGGVNLAGANLTRAQLGGAKLGAATLTDAILAEANLCGADLSQTQGDAKSYAGAQYDKATRWPPGVRPDSVSAIRALHHRCPSIQVLVLTGFLDEQRVREAMRAGAVGYLLKAAERDELLDAIRAARKGRSTLSLEAIQALIQGVDLAPNSAPTPPQVPLTEREQEVLALVVRGLRNDEIAHELVISLATVKYHLGHLFAKLVVSSRTELVRVALQRHLCPELSGSCVSDGE